MSITYAVRRVDDGKWLRRTSSGREFVADENKATTWSGAGHAKAALTHAGHHVAGKAFEIVEMRVECGDVIEVVTLADSIDGSGGTWKHKIVKTEKRPRGRFRQVDQSPQGDFDVG